MWNVDASGAARERTERRQFTSMELVPRDCDVEADEARLPIALVTSGRRVPVPAKNMLEIDHDVSAVSLRDPPLQPGLVYAGRAADRHRHERVSAIHGVVSVSTAGPDTLDEADEFASLDMITLEAEPPQMFMIEAQWAAAARAKAAVLPVTRERRRPRAQAVAPDAADNLLAAAGVAAVGAMIGLFLMLWSGYGAV